MASVGCPVQARCGVGQVPQAYHSPAPPQAKAPPSALRRWVRVPWNMMSGGTLELAALVAPTVRTTVAILFSSSFPRSWMKSVPEWATTLALVLDPATRHRAMFSGLCVRPPGPSWAGRGLPSPAPQRPRWGPQKTTNGSDEGRPPAPARGTSPPRAPCFRRGPRTCSVTNRAVPEGKRGPRGGSR